MDELKNRILDVLKNSPFVTLATITTDGRPWVRYVSPKVCDCLTLKVATSKSSRKVAQIKARREVHITAGVNDINTPSPFIQYQATAEILDDEQSRHDVWREEFGSFFKGPDDPDLCVIKIVPYCIEYFNFDSLTPEIWESK